MSLQSAVQKHLHRLSRKSKRLMWRLRGSITQDVTVSTQQGLLTVFTADQFIGKSLYLTGQFEYDWVCAALQWLRNEQKLPPQGTGTILDIGANMGVISIGMLTGGEFPRAIAVEPDPRNYALLQRNVRQNGLDARRYICLPYAASDCRGELEFELSHDNFGDHRVRVDANSLGSSAEKFDESRRSSISISAAPIDELLAELPLDVTADIAAVWIDTQGHEAQVFRGGARLFSRDIPVVSEIWPYGLARAGTTAEQFCHTASQYWSSFCVWQHDHFERRPITELARLLDNLKHDTQHENVIFLK